MFADTCSVAAPVPFVGVTLNQGTVLTAVQASAPAPLLESWTVWAAGFAPGSTPLKLNELADATSAAVGGVLGAVTSTLLNVTTWFETSSAIAPAAYVASVAVINSLPS